MDNASSHKAKKLKNLLTFFNVLFLAPYSPFMNAIEEFFGLSKYYYRRSILKNQMNLDKNVVEAFKKVNSEKIYSFFYHTLTFADDCFCRKEIV